VGRSVHAADEAAAASRAGGLDYQLFGTVFESASKPGRTPAGLDALRDAVAATTLPVLAVGGMTHERWPEVRAVGAAGFAAIGLFA
jgi:thiamine monophosphate synthase